MISRVLIIDDEPDWQETFKDIFASVGCDADSVADISRAKELLKTTPYELIILDIFLNPTQVPLNYESFLTFIARAYPEVIVVAVTGKQLAPDEAFALSRLGVSDFIYKPRVHLDDVRRLAYRILDLGEMEKSSIGTLEQELERIERLLTNGIEALSTSVAEVTGLTRAVIKLASVDVSDCPRLFTLKEASGKGVSKAARVSYLLTLWCEYPGAEHAWDVATYKFSRPREWLRRVAPYGLLVSRVLSVVIPIAASLPGVVLSGQDFQRVQNQLELMKEVAAQLPQIKVCPSVTSTTVDRLTPEEGAGLRALRAMLLTEDKDRILGDLRKVGTEIGGIIWVCPKHEEMLRTL
jgi:CheY-like chemotaxis protein